MSDVTYIITVPSERLLGLSGKTWYDAAGTPISPEEATQKPQADTAKKDVDKDLDEKGAEEDGITKAAVGKEDHDSSNGDDEDKDELIEDDISYRDGPDEFEDFEWMQSMYGEATIPDDTSDKKLKRIANCVAKLIHRDDIRRTFYADMEAPSHDTSDLAFDLFDRYGCLKRDFMKHPVKKGSGVWGEEFDEGDILLIESVTVEKDYQRQGVATKLANSVREKALELCPSVQYALVLATHLNTSSCRLEASHLSDIERKARFDKSQGRAVAFWRSLGYRRVGFTQWFCLAGNPNHPSHRLAASDDWDPPVHEVPIGDGRDLKDIYPVHFAIDHSSDDDAVIFLRQRLLSCPATDPSWSNLDREGKSLVHYAAECSKPRTLRWMFDQPFGEELLRGRNHAGETPLEALEAVLETDRTQRNFGMMIIPVSDQFTGFKIESVACLLLLRGMFNPPATDIKRVAYGCTCGECLGGFLSPRMTFAILCQAEMAHDMLHQELEGISGPEWYMMHDWQFRYMSPRVRASLKTNKLLRQGCTNIFDHIGTCLCAKLVPTTESVLLAVDAASEWPPCTKSFLERGGTVASAMLHLFDAAMDQDKMFGDGEHQVEFHEEIDRLKQCRNDNEWGFVRRLCGFANDGEDLGMVNDGEDLGMGVDGPQVLGKRAREEQTDDDFYGATKRLA